MHGLGTIINSAAVLAGGLLGILFGKFFKEQLRSSLTKACGAGVIFVSVASAMEGMLKVEGEKVIGVNGIIVVLCIVLGTFFGELINIERWFEKFGEWLKKKTGSSSDTSFLTGFLTCSFTVCIGAMTVVGAVEDGIRGNWTILATKAILDFFFVMVMAGTYGKGCVFSVIPVLVIEGGVTLASFFLTPVIDDRALMFLGTVGSVLIFCVGINLLLDKKIRVANMLPSLILAALATFIPAGIF